MPEYLAPGVYVEEIPSGNKPIQVASTSTAGMVGMTARGPVGTPTLVSSRGAYARIFGGDLNPLAFTDNRDVLPYAVEGFFNNGGARLYVVRVVGDAATESQLELFATNTAVDAAPTLAAPAAQGDVTLALTDSAAVPNGTQLLITDGAASETVTIGALAREDRVQLNGGLANDHANGDAVTLQILAPVDDVQLTQSASAGETTLTVDDSAQLTVATDYLLVSASGGTSELVRVVTLASATSVTLDGPLAADHGNGSTFSSLADGAATTLAAAATASPARVLLEVAAVAGIDAGDVIKIGGATTELAIVSGVPEVVPITSALTANHAANIALVPATRVLTMHARYAGAWGDSLRLSAGASSILSTQVTNAEVATSSTVHVRSAFGLFRGSIVVINGTLTREVAAVDTTNGIVTLTEAHGVALTAGTTVVSQEFSLTIDRIEGNRAAESERFDRLSLASTHPRYAPTLVGRWDAIAGAPSEGGGSNLVRLEDNATATTRRLPLVAGVARFLDGGDDDIAGVDDDAYVGNASDDPRDRTGIQALENEPTLSIVAVPGRNSLTVQNALVDHCNHMRYRFAVIDTPIGASPDAARTYRQNFDTTRAAVYYPSLEIADRFAPGERKAIPSSGHVLGIYARTDIARGVHKAPANEVVAGVLSFDNKLDKSVQDILNPINLNCFRDFRTENRGLRVYGGRVATSDPEWRYVNVRRLLLFIEQSLDTGLQWAVFEPNGEPLWATVKQSVTNFLTTVWRNGALEGTKAEEAFFVNVGYDVTMTQDDIDNGRLIIEIGVAPVKPAEFVIVRISQKTREATS